MRAVRYEPPDTGGTVTLEISAELAKLFQGFIGTISMRDLKHLPRAAEVRDEITRVHTEMHALFGQTQWQFRGHEIRFDRGEGR